MGATLPQRTLERAHEAADRLDARPRHPHAARHCDPVELGLVQIEHALGIPAHTDPAAPAALEASSTWLRDVRRGPSYATGGAYSIRWIDFIGATSGTTNEVRLNSDASGNNTVTFARNALFWNGSVWRTSDGQWYAAFPDFQASNRIGAGQNNADYIQSKMRCSYPDAEVMAAIINRCQGVLNVRSGDGSMEDFLQQVRNG